MSRPSASLNSLFLNASPRPVISQRQEPRIVENRLSVSYKEYRKGAGSAWGDFPTDTGAITWGFDADGGQWFEATATVSVTERVWASFFFPAVLGQTYIISFTVDSKSGTHTGTNNITVSGGSFTGTTSISNAAVGRHALVLVATSTATITVRIGVGTAANNGATGAMRFSNVMLEMPIDSTRAVPWEYVTPGDMRAFPYTYSTSLAGTVVNAPTLGTPYAIPTRSSVLVIGDSFSNDPPSIPTSFGDFPFQMRRFLYGKPIAINTRGVSGMRTDEITPQIAAAFAETDLTAGVSPYTLCLMEGGINDIVQDKTLGQVQAAKLEQINTALSYGMYPVLVGVAPLNSITEPRQAVLDAYNAWLPTLGYPFYDMYADANDGAGDFKTSWGSGDGVHPGQGYSDGSAIMGKRLADLLMLIGDK